MPWTMNLNFPVFHGGNDNPVDWLCLAERYFKYLKTPDEKKVEIAFLHLQGDAIPWMTGLYEPYHSLDSWSQFVVNFLKFCGPGECIDIEIALSNHKQTGSVKEYTTEFLRLYSALDFARIQQNSLSQTQSR